MTEVAARYESSTSFDLSIFVAAGLYFLTFFPNRFQEYIANWKNLLAYLVISSGNSHLLSSALEMILTFSERQNLLLRYLIRKKNLMIGMEKGYFLFFPPFSLIYSFSPFMESLLPQGQDEQSLLLLDGPCKSIFLSVIRSSCSASVFCVGTSITEIISPPSLMIIFLVMFLPWITRFFTTWNHSAITHDICARREKLKDNWRQGLNSVMPVEVARIQYKNDRKSYEIKSKINPSHLMIWCINVYIHGRSINIYIYELPKEWPNKIKLARLFCYKVVDTWYNLEPVICDVSLTYLQYSIVCYF